MIDEATTETRTAIPLFGLGNQQRSPFISTVERINCVVEMTDNGRQQAAILGLPGLVEFIDFGELPARGVFSTDNDLTFYVVTGDQNGRSFVILADVNVLIYAFRTDAEQHKTYRAWLEGVLNGSSAYGVAPQVLAGVVRITTHPKIFNQPSTLGDALAFCKALTEQPHAALIVPGERHWSIFESLCKSARANGNLVQDAWFAALAIEAGCEWITVDRDYARFNGLTWRAPF